jgi:cytochrome c oxidase subunit IV
MSTQAAPIEHGTGNTGANSPLEHGDSHAEGHSHPNEGTYFVVFVTLAFLTVVELLVVYIPGLKVPLLLGLAIGKAWLVVQFFMHLRYDAKLFSWTFLIPVVSGVIITILLAPLVGG